MIGAKRSSLWSLPRPVWLLGFVSLLTDTATEAIYPLMPVFLTSLGATPLAIGFIEGSAEAVASAGKIAAGWWSDRLRRRQPIVLAGYTLSSLARPLVALATSWWHVWIVRFVDRIGKGVRGAPRDALLAEYAPAGQRGRVFGFHRAMDHLGAVIGPVLASFYLWNQPGDFRGLFAWTIVPGLAVVVLLFRLRDPAPAQRAQPSSQHQSHRLGLPFWRLMAVLAMFTLGNSTDVFLLLSLNQAGVAAAWLPLLWSAQHVVKSASSLAGGGLADRLGRRLSIGFGWAIYAGIYAGFATAPRIGVLVALFLTYGLYYGLTEGAEKALIADCVDAEARGKAFGVYGMVLGLGGLVASLLFGLIWSRVSPSAAFLTGAGLALAATAGLAVVRPSR